MKKKYLIIVIVLMIFAVGCNNKESTAFKEGQTALENHEYDKAKKYLSDVLEQDSKNESARCMYIQATKMSKAEYYKNKGLYNKSLDNLDGLVNLENGSQKIKVESQELKKEVEKLKSEEEEASNIRKANVKEVAKKAVEKSEEELYIWQKNQENNSNTEDDDKNQDGDSSDTNIIDNIKNALGGLFNF